MIRMFPGIVVRMVYGDEEGERGLVMNFYLVGELPGKDCGGICVSCDNLAYVVLEGVDDGGIRVELRLGLSVSEQIVDIVYLTSVIGPLAF